MKRITIDPEILDFSRNACHITADFGSVTTLYNCHLVNPSFYCTSNIAANAICYITLN